MFGQLVAAHRRRLGLTQEELAERSGLSVRTIRALEADAGRVPRPASVRLLVDALGIQGAEREEFRRSATASGRAGAPPADELSASRPVRAVAPTPAQLPPSLAGFVGRAAELARLDTALARPSAGAGGRIWVVAGTAGVGKTTLALHWAHRVLAHFPDGQLYVNLRGYDPTQAPRRPAEVVFEFLRAMGVASPDIPAEPEARTALYRSVLHGRRTLVVLDNAADAEQVRPLLPGTASCAAVITSRDHLSGLIAHEGAEWMRLDLFSLAEAREVCTRRMGARAVRADPEAVDHIIESCARLPLALAVVTARAVTGGSLQLSSIAAGLGDLRGRLGGPTGEGALSDVRAAFSWSYEAVSRPAARLFRLLALHPGPTFAEATTASLAGTAVEDTRAALAELVGAHLIAAELGGRYSFHDLLRAYALELVEQHEPASEQRAAWTRMFVHYLHSTQRAALLLRPDRDAIALPPVGPDVTVVALADSERAREWLDLELLAIMDVIDRCDDPDCWRLAWGLADYCHWAGRWQDWAATHRRALDVTIRYGDRPGMVYCHSGLAIAHTIGNDYDAAQHHHEQALALFEELGDRAGIARTHFNLANVFEYQGRYREALDHARRALDLRRDDAPAGPLANAYNAVGWYHALLGEYDAALAHCEKALDIHRHGRARHGHGATLDSLGYIFHHMGRYDEAAARYRQAAEMFATIGDEHYQATVLTRLADTQDEAGQPDEATKARRQALEILERLGDPAADTVRAQLSR